MRDKRTSEQKAFDFWLSTIKEAEKHVAFYRAGVEWMVKYWNDKLKEINNA